MKQSLVHIKSFGGETPVQCWGTLLDRYFFFRARYRHWTFSVGEKHDVMSMSDDDIARLDLYLEEEYGEGPYDAGYMPFAESRELITDAICRYLRQRGVDDIESERGNLSAWFGRWSMENPDYQARGVNR